MNYKELFNKMMLVLGSPSKAWETIRDEEESEELLTSYVYPLIAICGIALFVGLFFGNGVEEFDFRITLTKCCGLFISLFGGFFLSAYLVEGFGKRMLNDHPENTKENTKKLVGYSMTVIFVLEFFAAIFPSFFIIKWIAQFYLIYVVWEGSKVLMRIPENQLLSYTLISSIIILVSPVVINYAFNWLSQMAK
jgi:hypothetical protein